MRPSISPILGASSQFNKKQQNSSMHYADKSGAIYCHNRSYGRRMNDISVTAELLSSQKAKCMQQVAGWERETDAIDRAAEIHELLSMTRKATDKERERVRVRGRVCVCVCICVCMCVCP